MRDVAKNVNAAVIYIFMNVLLNVGRKEQLGGQKRLRN